MARAGAAPGGSELSRDRADVSMPKRSARSGDPAEDAEASRRQAPRKKARRRLPIDIRGRGAGAMARKRSMRQCLVLGCLCTQPLAFVPTFLRLHLNFQHVRIAHIRRRLSSLDFLGARQLPRRLGLQSPAANATRCIAARGALSCHGGRRQWPRCPGH